MNRHRILFMVLAAQALTLCALLAAGRWEVARFEGSGLGKAQEVVAGLGLTDLALGSEARYTRNPSQADRFAPFQDFPSAIEHYPAGSVFGPGEERPHEAAVRPLASGKRARRW